MTLHPRHQDHYSRLGVTEDATPQEIRQAFRRRAKQFHPDVNAAPEAADAFRAIRAAYDVLRNEESRRDYDDFRDDDFYEFDEPEFDDDAYDDHTDDNQKQKVATDEMFDAAVPDVAAAAPVTLRRPPPRRPVWFAALGLAGVVGATAVFGLARMPAHAPQPLEMADAGPVAGVVATRPPVVAMTPAVAPLVLPPLAPIELHPKSHPAASHPAVPSTPAGAATPAAAPPPPKPTLVATTTPVDAPPPAMKVAAAPQISTAPSAAAAPPPVAQRAPTLAPHRILHPQVLRARIQRAQVLRPVDRARWIAAQAARARYLAAVQAHRARLARASRPTVRRIWRRPYATG